MSNENTLQRIRELRVDALYEKKKHYNAADRKAKYNLWFGIPNLVANVIVSSVLFALLAYRGSFAPIMIWIGAILSLITGILGGLQTFFKYPKVVEGHRAIASRFLAIAKECRRIEAYILDEQMDPQALHEQLERLGRTYDDVVKDATPFLTNKKDYNLAQKGFTENEEEYTEQELNYRGE